MKKRFLKQDATSATLIKAAAKNHTEWFQANATNIGGALNRTGSVNWSESKEEIVICFPQLKATNADSVLDEIVSARWAKRIPKASCWIFSEAQPKDLGARLIARGFEQGWKPHIMAMDFRKLPESFDLPDGLEIKIDDAAEWQTDDLPYYGARESAIQDRLSFISPRKFWHFGAWLNGEKAGHSVLFLNEGANGVAGVYNVGVLPKHRRKGIAKALMLELCRFAQSHGCNYATLNSAADEFYDSIGFDSIGWGQTWWMHGKSLNSPPPTVSQIRFAEAICRGNLKTLEALAASEIPVDLNAPLLNGHTPMENVAEAGKAVSANWLVSKGAILHLIEAWDLGLKDCFPQLIANDPDAINKRSKNWNATPLHEAVERNCVELVKLILQFKPDLNAKDTEYHAIPLGWAKHFGHTEISTLLESAMMEESAKTEDQIEK